jgi:alpha-ketoglutarate-dependent taurine dioxygenase
MSTTMNATLLDTLADESTGYWAWSVESEHEARRLARQADADVAPERLAISAHHWPALAADVAAAARHLYEGPGLVIFRPVEGMAHRERRILAWATACLLGEPLVQNSEGSRQIHVYDRDPLKRMADGARYHQTREGGSMHTDNVNIPEPWEYLVFACIEPGLVGGESVLVDGNAAHAYLQDHLPEALDLLEQPFWWEYRGIADKLYQAPVITYGPSGEPQFRYLRPYLESAHRKAGEPLTVQQMWALDVLDSVLDLSALQHRVALQAGEILLTLDYRILHGRTCFADPLGAAALSETATPVHGPIKRTFDRMWVRKQQETEA